MEFVLNEYHRNIPDEKLLSDVKKVAEMLGKKSLTQSDYTQHGKYSVDTIRKRFRSWNLALELCGMQANYRQVKTGEFLADIKRVASHLHKKTISSSEYQQYGIYSRDICFRRFSSWDEALKQAGLEPYRNFPGNRINDEDMLKEIERIWIKLGRQPTSSDIKTGISQYSLHAYAEHFGGWRGALEAFVKYINEEELVTEFIDEEESVDEAVVAGEEGSRRNIVATAKIDKPRHKTSRDVNYRLRFKVMQRDNFKCCLCGKSPAKDPSIELHIDHIFPWSKGGETVIDNLQTLCSVCNLGKGNLVTE